MYTHLVIDQEHNRLLCNPSLVGMGEIVEIYEADEQTDRFLVGAHLVKLKDPNHFQVWESDRVSKIGDKCVLRVLYRNRSGVRKRRFSQDEKIIVNMEKGPDHKDIKIRKTKTGSVRNKKTKKRGRPRKKK